MNANTVPRRRQAALRRERRRSSTGAPEAACSWAAEVTSRDLRPACVRELRVDLLVHVGEPALEVRDLAGLPFRHEGVEERSEEHTSELQSRENLVCRLLLEKKKTKAVHRAQVPRTHNDHTDPR